LAALQNWIADIPDHPLNQGKRPLARMSDKQKAEVAEATRKELEAKFIIVPPGEEGKELRCGICMEKVNLEFMEEDGDGEWVWKNAVKVDNKVGSSPRSGSQLTSKSKIYHATCHYDWSNSTFNKQRLLEGGLSRQGTPEAISRLEGTPIRMKSNSPKTPPVQLLSLAGTKRKATSGVEAAKPASPSSKEGTPMLRGDDDEPRIKRRAIQV
jgi:pre-mRNA cleavage complex 2 protein Pcf11